MAGGVLPAGLPGYDEDLHPYEYDPDLARELLAQSSYGSAEALPPVTITVSGYANQIPDYIAAVILDWRQNLGVEVSVRQLESEVFLYYLEEERDQAFAMGWIADYPQPQLPGNAVQHRGVIQHLGVCESGSGGLAGAGRP